MAPNESNQSTRSRRTVLKQAAAASAVTGVSTTALAGTAAASQSTLYINGGSSTTWSSYEVIVDDPNASADINSRDTIENDYYYGGCNQNTRIDGYVKDGGTDTVYFDGSIRYLLVSWDAYEDDFGGDIYFEVDGGLDRDSQNGYMDVYHNGEGGDYEFCMTGDVSAMSGIEDNDSVGDTCADGQGCCAGNDYYHADGEVTYASIQTGGDGYVELRHSYDNEPC